MTSVRWACSLNRCISETLRVYPDAIDGTVYHYRDGNGLECDAVVHLRNGNYGLIEVKLGGDKNIEEGAKNLKLLASKIDDTKMKSPSFLMVLTGTSRYAVRRDRWCVCCANWLFERLIKIQNLCTLAP